MKRNGWIYAAGIVAFLAIVFAVMQSGPRKFSWDVTYAPESDEPFGTALFDSLMGRSLPGGYELSTTDLVSLATYDTLHPKNVLLLPDVSNVSWPDRYNVLEIAERGGTVMVVNNCPSEWNDMLGYETRYAGYTLFNYNKITRTLRSNGQPDVDSLVWTGHGAYNQDTTYLWQAMSSHCFIEKFDWNDEMTPLITDANGNTMALLIPFGKGKLVLVTSSLLYSNFSVLQPENRKMLLRLMNEFGNGHVVRLVPPGTAEGGVFCVMRREPPLRLAWQLAMVGVLLALTVNARRRQRAIPALRHSRNVTLAFIRQHASLFRKRTDHASLVRRKYRSFAAEMRRRWNVDVEDTAPATRREQAHRLAAAIRRDPNDVMWKLEQLDMIRLTGGHVSPQMFMEAVVLMDNLLGRSDDVLPHPADGNGAEA